MAEITLYRGNAGAFKNIAIFFAGVGFADTMFYFGGVPRGFLSALFAFTMAIIAWYLYRRGSKKFSWKDGEPAPTVNEMMGYVTNTLRWEPFFFDGNLWFNEVNTPDDWEDCVKTYHGTKVSLLGAHRCLKYDTPRFGFYSEYTDNETLGEWAAKQGMKL